MMVRTSLCLLVSLLPNETFLADHWYSARLLHKRGQFVETRLGLGFYKQP